MAKKGKKTRKKSRKKEVICIEPEKEKITHGTLPELLGKTPVDNTDMELLKILQHNGRMSNIELAEKLNMSEATVRRRINNLVSMDLIRGFSALLNYKKLGNGVKASIYVKVKKDSMEKVANKLGKSGNVCTVYQVIGNYNLYSELFFGDLLELQVFMDEMSQTESIEQMEYHIVTKTYKPCPWSGI
jgi:DNA-binding Lrp family transcriptional regulator